MLSDISSDILSDISKTKHSIHSFTQKPLHKLYIYLTPRSKSNIHDSFVSVKWQFYSCIRLHRTAPPRSSWVQRCKAPAATHTPHASDRPAKKAVESKRCNPGSGAATTSHGVCKPWSQMLATVVLSPFLCRWLCSAHHLFPTRALQSPKTRPKYERLQRLLALRIWNRPPFICHIPLFPSTTSSMINIKSPACVVLGGSMHTYMRSAPTKVNL